MTLKRKIMSHIGSGAIGLIGGYYIGVKELLGIQSDTSQLGTVTETETLGGENL